MKLLFKAYLRISFTAQLTMMRDLFYSLNFLYELIQVCQSEELKEGVF